MKTQRTFLLSLGVVAAMAAGAAWAMSRIGGGLVATHFGLSGPDQFAPTPIGLWAHPLGGLALTLLFALLPKIMPKNATLDRSAGAYQTVWLSVLLLMAVMQAVMIAQALGASISTPARLVPLAVGLLMVVIGNLMGKIRYNYVFGVRTPWTLADERVWDRTHRFMGPWFMLWGVILAGSALLTPEAAGGLPLTRWVLIAGAITVAGLSMAYSYRASRRLGAS